MSYIVFARWFGIVSVLLAFGILFNLEDAKVMAKRMVNSETGYIMGAVLPIIFGSLSLLFADSFVPGWNLVVTAVGCAMLAAGAYRAIFVNHWKQTMAKNIEQIPFLFSLFGLMLGVILLYVGFIAQEFDFSGM